MVDPEEFDYVKAMADVDNEIMRVLPGPITLMSRQDLQKYYALRNRLYNNKVFEALNVDSIEGVVLHFMRLEGPIFWSHLFHKISHTYALGSHEVDEAIRKMIGLDILSQDSNYKLSISVKEKVRYCVEKLILEHGPINFISLSNSIAGELKLPHSLVDSKIRALLLSKCLVRTDDHQFITFPTQSSTEQ